MKALLSARKLSSKKNILHAVTACFILFTNSLHIAAQKEAKQLPPLSINKRQLVYLPDTLGNRIPDFSYCGYMASEKPIPTISVKVIVPVTKGDATLRIQSALDHVASLPLDANGFRGAVL